jgi:hypothetical protein
VRLDPPKPKLRNPWIDHDQNAGHPDEGDVELFPAPQARGAERDEPGQT